MADDKPPRAKPPGVGHAYREAAERGDTATIRTLDDGQFGAYRKGSGRRGKRSRKRTRR